MAELLDALAARIRESGPLRFDRYVEAALYDPVGGFFSRGLGSGRASADFITSPEVGPLFGELFARQLDRLWTEAGEPDQFDVVEAAAGRGALALAVRSAAPECASSLRYHLVERSSALRERQREHLRIEHDDGSRASSAEFGSGSSSWLEMPAFYSYSDLAEVEGPVDVVFANELVDNLAVRVLERTSGGWTELYVDLADNGNTSARGPASGTTERSANSDAVSRHPVLREILLPVPQLSDWADEVAPAAAIGARIPLQQSATEWLVAALNHVRDPGGFVILVDYCRTTGELAEVGQAAWLRTYRGHERGGSPLSAPGTQDITCDVARDQLVAAASARAGARLASDVSQREWLVDLGIEAMVAEGRREWEAKAASPDLAALKARSRIPEAEALCDQTGLGGFRVLSWRR